MKDSTANSLRKRWLDKSGRLAFEECQQELEDIYLNKGESFNRADYSTADKLFGMEVAYRETTADMVHPLGVIIETRKSANLDHVVTNFIQRTKLPVQLFHGVENRDFIISGGLSHFIRSGELILHQLNVNSLKRSDYNAIFLTKYFWESLASRGKIFVFQTDSIICGKSKYCLDDFLSFDYIGSRWERERAIGLTIDGGSGGLSIRDWQKSVECLETFNSRAWKGGEDGFFAFHIELLGGKIGRDEDCGKFSTQEFFTHHSFGAHKVSLLPPSQHEKFLSYCPEAAFMLSPTT
jgi:hypothetical protein